MTYGYCRVSTLDQNNDKFQSEILKYCNNKDLGKITFIEEKISGKKDWKNRQLGNLINNLCKEGDHIVCSELSRIVFKYPVPVK